MGHYLPIVALAVLAVLFAGLSFLASRLLAPRRPTPQKSAPYESGILPGKEPPRRFPVRFSIVAMIFIVFDIEVIFLYPWALVHDQLGLFGIVAIAIFSASVFESFLYLLSKGVLEWGPVQRVQRPHLVGAHRTAESTIRRVGLEGRDRPAEQRILAESGITVSNEPVGTGSGAH